MVNGVHVEKRRKKKKSKVRTDRGKGKKKPLFLGVQRDGRFRRGARSGRGRKIGPIVKWQSMKVKSKRHKDAGKGPERILF